MKLKKYEDWLAGFFFLAVALVYASQIPLIKHTKISPIDSRFIPTIVAVGMGGLAICQFVIAWRNSRKTAEKSQEAGSESRDYRRAGLTLGIALVYAILFKPLGFVLSSVAYLTAQMTLMAPPEQRKPARFLIISVVCVAVIYLIFHNGLDLMLPGGILTGIL